MAPRHQLHRWSAVCRSGRFWPHHAWRRHHLVPACTAGGRVRISTEPRGSRAWAPGIPISRRVVPEFAVLRLRRQHRARGHPPWPVVVDPPGLHHPGGHLHCRPVPVRSCRGVVHRTVMVYRHGGCFGSRLRRHVVVGVGRTVDQRADIGRYRGVLPHGEGMFRRPWLYGVGAPSRLRVVDTASGGQQRLPRFRLLSDHCDVYGSRCLRQRHPFDWNNLDRSAEGHPHSIELRGGRHLGVLPVRAVLHGAER